MSTDPQEGRRTPWRWLRGIIDAWQSSLFPGALRLQIRPDEKGLSMAWVPIYEPGPGRYPSRIEWDDLVAITRDWNDDTSTYTSDLMLRNEMQPSIPDGIDNLSELTEALHRLPSAQPEAWKAVPKRGEDCYVVWIRKQIRCPKCEAADIALTFSLRAKWMLSGTCSHCGVVAKFLGAAPVLSTCYRCRSDHLVEDEDPGSPWVWHSRQRCLRCRRLRVAGPAVWRGLMEHG